MGKRYHSGIISNGVAKGFALVLMLKGLIIANPQIIDLIPKITIYNLS